MGKIVLTDDEKILASRTAELLVRSSQENCPYFTDFLTDRERAIVLQTVTELAGKDRVITFGGYEEAERRIAGFFPEYCIYMDENELYDEFPITALKIECSGFREHNHRDFLGSILGLGLERFVTGDIIVGDKGYSATVFVHERIAGFLTENLKLVGRDGVKVTVCPKGEPVAVEKRFEKISGTVASFRIDALLSEVLNISREKSVKLIESGSVTVNHAEILSKSLEIGEGDIFTVKGYGKYKLSKIGDSNRKGRIRFETDKYT